MQLSHAEPVTTSARARTSAPARRVRSFTLAHPAAYFCRHDWSGVQDGCRRLNRYVSGGNNAAIRPGSVAQGRSRDPGQGQARQWACAHRESRLEARGRRHAARGWTTATNGPYLSRSTWPATAQRQVPAPGRPPTSPAHQASTRSETTTRTTTTALKPSTPHSVASLAWHGCGRSHHRPRCKSTGRWLHHSWNHPNPVQGRGASWLILAGPLRDSACTHDRPCTLCTLLASLILVLTGDCLSLRSVVLSHPPRSLAAEPFRAPRPSLPFAAPLAGKSARAMSAMPTPCKPAPKPAVRRCRAQTPQS